MAIESGQNDTPTPHTPTTPTNLRPVLDDRGTVVLPALSMETDVISNIGSFESLRETARFILQTPTIEHPEFNEIQTKLGLTKEELKGTGFELVSRSTLETLSHYLEQNELDAKAYGAAILANMEVAFQPEQRVTFIDFVGSTNMLSAAYNPETPSEHKGTLLKLYDKVIGKIAYYSEKYGGSAEQYQGDAVICTFPNKEFERLACRYMYEVLKKDLQSIRETIIEINQTIGTDYEPRAGIRILSTSANGLTVKTRPYVQGPVLEGKPASHDLPVIEGYAKELEKKGVVDPNGINLFEMFEGEEIEEVPLSTIDKDSSVKMSGLRISQDLQQNLKNVVRSAAATPHHIDKYPHTKQAVSVFIDWPNLGDSAYDRQLRERVMAMAFDVIGNHRGEIPKATPSNGFFVTFEEGDMDNLATRALDEIRTKTEKHFKEAGIMIASKGDVSPIVKINTGSNTRFEPGKAGKWIAAVARLQAQLIRDYSNGESSIIGSLTSEDSANDRCEVVEVLTGIEAKGFKENLSACLLGKLKPAKRVTQVDTEKPVVIIGEAANNLALNIEEAFKEKNVVSIEGISPVIKDTLKRLVEGTSGESMYFLKPEGKDVQEYLSLTQIVFEFVENKYTVEGGYITVEEKEKLFEAIAHGDKKAITTLLTKYFKAITEKEKLYICCDETELIHPETIQILEEVATKLKNGQYKLALVGSSLKEPDFRENMSSTLSKEECKELVGYILENKNSEPNKELISEEDLEAIVASIPKEEDGRIQGAYVFTWIEDLRRKGLVQPGLKASWAVDKKGVSNIKLSQNGVMLQVLASAEKELPGVTNTLLMISAARRAITLDEIPVDPSDGNAHLKKLIEYGIVKQTQGENGEEAGYTVESLYRRACEECLEGSEDLRVDVNLYILKKSRQTAATLMVPDFLDMTDKEDLQAAKRIRVAQNTWLLHAEEYFAYQRGNTVSEETLALYGEYLEILKAKACEYLDRRDYQGARNTLKPIMKHYEMLTRQCGDKNEQKATLMEYFEIVSILSRSYYFDKITKEESEEIESFLFSKNGINFKEAKDNPLRQIEDLNDEEKNKLDIIVMLSHARKGHQIISELHTQLQDIKSTKELEALKSDNTFTKKLNSTGRHIIECNRFFIEQDLENLHDSTSIYRCLEALLACTIAFRFLASIYFKLGEKDASKSFYRKSVLYSETLTAKMQHVETSKYYNNKAHQKISAMHENSMDQLVSTNIALIYKLNAKDVINNESKRVERKDLNLLKELSIKRLKSITDNDTTNFKDVELKANKIISDLEADHKSEVPSPLPQGILRQLGNFSHITKIYGRALITRGEVEKGKTAIKLATKAALLGHRVYREYEKSELNTPIIPYKIPLLMNAGEGAIEYGDEKTYRAIIKELGRVKISTDTFIELSNEIAILEDLAETAGMAA